jgi:hypothetical protein
MKNYAKNLRKASPHLPRHPLPVILALFATVLVMNPAAAAEDARDREDWQKSRLQREPGAHYLEDFYGGPTIRLKTGNQTLAYYTPKMERYLGTLKPLREVELLAISRQGLRVRGIAQQGQIAGWVRPDSLEQLEPEFVENLFKAAERREKVEALIEQNAVALGMTEEEVLRSLGKPERRTSLVAEEGTKSELEFITYERVPERVTGYDQFGRLVTSVVYVKKPVGRMTVVFEDGILSSVEQSEGDLVVTGGNIKIVPAPLYLVH